jgi:hypothetical protein
VRIERLRYRILCGLKTNDRPNAARAFGRSVDPDELICPPLKQEQGLARSMSEKDTISIQLVREALLQSCAPGATTDEVLNKVGIDPALLDSSDARVPATAYARLWRLLARRGDDEFFGMDPRKLKSGSLEFLCRCSMVQPSLAAGLT